MKTVRVRRLGSLALGAVSLGSVLPLLVWDAVPQWFPPQAHLVLGALPLALTAAVFLVYRAITQAAPQVFAQTAVAAAAFLFWAANQLLADLPQAMLLNDLAIALFVLDIALVMLAPTGN